MEAKKIIGYSLDGKKVDQSKIEKDHLFIDVNVWPFMDNGIKYESVTHRYATVFRGYSVSYKKPNNGTLLNVLVKTNNPLDASRRAEQFLKDRNLIEDYVEYGISKEVRRYPISKSIFIGILS